MGEAAGALCSVNLKVAAHTTEQIPFRYNLMLGHKMIKQPDSTM